MFFRSELVMVVNDEINSSSKEVNETACINLILTHLASKQKNEKKENDGTAKWELAVGKAVGPVDASMVIVGPAGMMILVHLKENEDAPNVLNVEVLPAELLMSTAFVIKSYLSYSSISA